MLDKSNIDITTWLPTDKHTLAVCPPFQMDVGFMLLIFLKTPGLKPPVPAFFYAAKVLHFNQINKFIYTFFSFFFDIFSPLCIFS